MGIRARWRPIAGVRFSRSDRLARTERQTPEAQNGGTAGTTEPQNGRAIATAEEGNHGSQNAQNAQNAR
jgi:hypothetical protein